MLNWQMVTRIETEADLKASLTALVAADPRLAAAAARVKTVPLRRHAPGLEGLLRIVVGQQLSTQSASAVWTRVREAYGAFDAAVLVAADDGALRATGLSRQKMVTFRAVAAAVVAGLDLEAVARADAADARASLEAIKGVGRWTADLYLMFCAGHPDILPVGDLAVRRGAAEVLGVGGGFTPAALEAEGAIWSPYRSTAARLFYTTYREARTGRQAPATTGAAEALGMPL